MVQNRGKQFEDVIKESFLKVPNTHVLRLHDQMTGYLGSKNICDFVVYKYPRQFLIECKSVHGNLLSLSNITDNQFQGLLNASKIPGIVAGVICWWVDHDVTKFIPSQILAAIKDKKKSIRFDDPLACYYHGFPYEAIEITGKKKRVFFDYDMEAFLGGFY